jgi:hypothetical protein
LSTGGHYRGGRQERWRFEVSDQQGELIPMKPEPHSPGEWLSGFKMLEFGQSYETKLEMGKYVEPLAPGRYWVRLIYHNSKTIDDRKDISGLIVFRSDPFELIVRPGGVGSQPAVPATREGK